MRKNKMGGRSRQLLSMISAVFIAILLASCGNVGDVATNVNENKLHFNSQQQFVPVLANQITTASAEIINNNDTALTNIDYHVIVNGGQNLANQVTLDANNCAHIAAHSSCWVSFKVMEGDDLSGGGSATIVASYQLNGQQHNQSTMIDYDLVEQKNLMTAAQVNLQYGVENSTSVESSNVLYATNLYMVNPESDSYILQDITTIASPTVPIQIVKTDSQNREVAADSVSTIPVQILASGQSQVRDQVVKLTLRLVNKTTHEQVVRNVNVYMQNLNAVSAGPILTSGVVATVNGESSLNINLTVYNTGNKPATITTLAPVGGLSYSTGVNACSTTTGSNTVPAGSSCTIYLTITQGYSGNSNLSVTYSGTNGTNSLTKNLQWTFQGGPDIGLFTNLPAAGVYSPATGSLTLSNITNYPVTINSISSAGSTGTAAVAAADSNCVGQTLNVNKTSCTTTLNVTGLGQAKIIVNASYINSSGTTVSLKGIPISLLNVYTKGAWSPVGATIANGFGLASYNASPGNAINASIDMAISPVNNQPYVITGAQLGTTPSAFRFVVMTYNGTKWQQVGQQIPVGATTTNIPTITHIAFNPVTKVPWIMVWQGLNKNLAFYYYNSATNTWVTAAPTIVIPTNAVQNVVNENNSMSMAFDNSGNLYIAYPNPNDTTNYQIMVSKLVYGGSTWTTVGNTNQAAYAITGNAGAGYKAVALAINPATQMPWIVYYDYATGTPTSSPVFVKYFNGSTFVLSSSGAGLVKTTSSYTGLAIAFNPKTTNIVGVFITDYNAANNNAFQFDGTTWSNLNSVSSPYAMGASITYGADGTGPYVSCGTSTAITPVVYKYNGGGTWSTYGGPVSGFTVNQYYSSTSAGRPYTTVIGFDSNSALVASYSFGLNSASYTTPNVFVDSYHP